MQLSNAIALSPLRQLINWIARHYDFLDDCARNYGDSFSINLPSSSPLVLISDLEPKKFNPERFLVGCSIRTIGSYNYFIISSSL